jgi:general stress protein 26
VLFVLIVFLIKTIPIEMTKEFIYRCVKPHNLAVISTISKEQKPEAALVGFAVSDALEIIFDTVNTSRKYPNLLQNPLVAVVIGWDDETTIQLEGIASVLTGSDGERCKEINYGVYPDGRERAKTWPDIVHFKITPN